MTIYELDGAPTLQDPIDQGWDAPVLLDKDHLGAPLYGAFRSCRLTFNTMPTANLNQWVGKDDGATHSIKMPAPGTGTLTTYSGIFIRYVDARRGATLKIYDTEFIIEHITV